MPRVHSTGLTDKEKKFVDVYCLTLSLAEAARQAGYSKNNSRQVGWAVYQKSHIKKAIEERLAEFHMSANDALRRQADIARGDIGDFLAISKDGFYIDLEQARELGLTRLIKKIKTKKTTNTDSRNKKSTEIRLDEIELYPADVAQERILRIAGVFKDGQIGGGESVAGFTIPPDQIAPTFASVYRDIVNKQHTEYILRGGRGSTKSAFVAEMFIYLLINNPLMHGLALRQVADTLRDSVFGELQKAINRLGLSDKFHPTTSPMEIEYLPTGQKIYFRGADDPNKIKSITPVFGYIGAVWFEELDQFHGQNAIRTVEQSIRGGDDIIYFKSFNPPPTRSNWANKYLETPKANQYQHFSNYLGLPEEYLRNEELRKAVPLEMMIEACKNMAVPQEWLGNTWLQDAEHLRNTKPDAFEHEYLGIPVNDGSLVFTNLNIRMIADEEISQFDNVRHGLDWGYYPDPASYGKMYFDSTRRKLYIFGEYRAFKKSNEDLHKALIDSKLYSDDELLIADSAEPKSVDDFRAYGASCRGAEKGPGTRDYSYKWLQGLNEIIIDNIRAPYHAEEFQNCEYEKTKDGEIISEYPEKNDHAIDDTRYGTNPIWRRRGE